MNTKTTFPESRAKVIQTITPEEKTEKVARAREYHKKLLKDNNAKLTDFNLKLWFFDKGIKVVAIFPGEFQKENGFYFELIDSNLDPIDPKRTIYKINPRNNYDDTYNILKSGAYAVPLEELEVVEDNTTRVDNSLYLDQNITTNLSSDNDQNISEMTIKDIAAILWKSPVSEKEWLNNLIKTIKE